MAATIVLSPQELARFAAKTRWDGDCLVWSGYRNADGYGKLTVRNRQWAAHRLAYVDAWGAIPEGELVRHKCDNPACVNPSHLETGTNADNARDKAERRRAKTKITDAEVVAIRSDKRRLRQIAQQFSISASSVCLIKAGKRRKYVGG